MLRPALLWGLEIAFFPPELRGNPFLWDNSPSPDIFLGDLLHNYLNGSSSGKQKLEKEVVFRQLLISKPSLCKEAFLLLIGIKKIKNCK